MIAFVFELGLSLLIKVSLLLLLIIESKIAHFGNFNFEHINRSHDLAENEYDLHQRLINWIYGNRDVEK